MRVLSSIRLFRSAVYMESPIAGSMLSEPGTAPIAANVILDLAIHRSAALRLATRIAGNAEDAEDIVQEAFLRLVRFRSTLRPGPEARALLLRCVLLAGRNFYASKRRRQDHEAAHVRNRDSFSKSEHSRDNLQSAVKLALQTLDENLRLPVSLHYEQGLSYAEAAQILSVPEATLRVYAQRGVQKLRDKLAREGYTLAPAVLIALLRGEQTISRVVEAARRTNPLRRSRISSGGTVWATIVAGVVAAGALALLAQRESNPPARQASAGSAAVELRSPAPATPAAAIAPFHHIWRFDRGPADELTVPVGGWKWKDGDENHPGVMQVSDTAGVELPRVSEQPFVVTITCRPVAADFEIGAEWSNVFPQRLWYLRIHDAQSGLYVRRVYFLGHYVIHSIDMPNRTGFVDLIDDYPKAFPTDQLHLVLRGVNVEQIEMQSLRPDEVPAAYRNPLQLTTGMTAVHH